MVKGRPPRHIPNAILSKKMLDVVINRHERTSLVDGIFELVTENIKSGNLVVGHRLVSVRQMSNDCQVSRDTVVRAYEKLVAHGHLESRAGSGFFVMGNGRLPLRQFDVPLAKRPLLPDWKQLRTLQTASGDAMNPGSGLLPSDWMDEHALGLAMRALARSSQHHLGAYGDLHGYLPLRLQLQAKLKEVQIQVSVDQIMITTGASDAVHMLLLSKARELGEVMLVESPCSFLLRDRLMASGLTPIFIPREADGPDIEALRDACKTHKPRFFFFSSILHNPTSSHIAPYKAYQMLRLAEEFDLTLVEDDTYGDLMAVGPNNGVMRLASLDQLKRVIYISSFSKTVAAGLRVGFICGPDELIDWMLVYRRVCGIAAPQLSERVLYQFLSEGTYRHHCVQLRQKLDRYRQPVANKLISIGCEIESMPDAGMYLWVTLPKGIDADVIADALYEQGYYFAPGSLFLSEDDPLYSRRMRFNVGRTLDSPDLLAFEKLLRES